MSDIQPDLPDPISKAIEANQEAEDILNKGPKPDVALAQAWATVASNWASLIDPRSPGLRRLARPQTNKPRNQ